MHERRLCTSRERGSLWSLDGKVEVPLQGAIRYGFPSYLPPLPAARACAAQPWLYHTTKAPAKHECRRPARELRGYAAHRLHRAKNRRVRRLELPAGRNKRMVHCMASCGCEACYASRLLVHECRNCAEHVHHASSLSLLSPALPLHACAGAGSAIMRGSMVANSINALNTHTKSELESI